VEASSRAGWSPSRYRAEKVAFVVRSMTTVHHREVTYGERTTARTWVNRFRRDMFSTRQVRLFGDEGPVASATQEWVHVSEELKPTRASPDLLDSFPIHEESPRFEFPSWVPVDGSNHRLSFSCWHTWMDPLDHVNHPAYVDWCDEAVSEVMKRAGLTPVQLQPVAERLTFKAGVTAGDRVTVESKRIGHTTDGSLVLRHRILKNDGIECAAGETVRRLAVGDSRRLVAAWDD